MAAKLHNSVVIFTKGPWSCARKRAHNPRPKVIITVLCKIAVIRSTTEFTRMLSVERGLRLNSHLKGVSKYSGYFFMFFFRTA